MNPILLTAVQSIHMHYNASVTSLQEKIWFQFRIIMPCENAIMNLINIDIGMVIVTFFICTTNFA